MWSSHFHYLCSPCICRGYVDIARSHCTLGCCSRLRLGLWSSRLTRSGSSKSNQNARDMGDQWDSPQQNLVSKRVTHLVLTLLSKIFKKSLIESEKVLPGCSLHCEHFFENTITPSFRDGIIWIFGMLIIDVLSMNVILWSFSKKLLFLAKKDKSVNVFWIFLPIEFASFCLGFSSGKNFKF